MDIRKIFSRKGSETRSTSQAGEQDKTLGGVTNVSTGKGDITESDAGRISAFNSCASIIGQDLAKIPLHVMQQTGRINEYATSHKVYNLLYLRPNPEMSSYVFRQFLFTSAVKRGNAFAQIRRDFNGTPFELWPIHPDRVSISRNLATNELEYRITLDNGKPIVLSANDVLHIKGDTEDGIVGISPVKLHALSLGIAFSQEEFGKAYYDNGAHVDLAITLPTEVAVADKPVRDKYKSDIEERHTGGANSAYRIMWFAPGGDVKNITPTLEQIQFLNGRRFSRTEVAGMCRVPPQKIGEYGEMRYATAEAMEQAYINDALVPWGVQFEQECNWKLFSESERSTYKVKFNFGGLVRGDMKVRYDSYHLALNDGWLNRNEARELEDKNPVEGLDDYLVPLNMGTATDANATQQAGKRHAHNHMERRADDDAEAKRVAYAEKRIRVKNNLKRLLKVEAERVVKREKQDLEALIKKHLKQRSVATFTQAVTTYYSTYMDVVIERMTQPMLTLAEAIREEAQAEVDSTADIGPEVEKFVNDYVRNYAKKYVRSSVSQVEWVLAHAEEAGTDPADAMQERLDEWMDNRAGKVADNESTDLANAVTKMAWRLAGITLLRWHTTGSETCPFCQNLDGKVISIDKTFVSANETLSAEGKSPLTTDHNVSHAPLHAGCDCTISPG